MGAIFATKGTSFVGFKNPQAPVVVNAGILSSILAPKVVQKHSPNGKMTHIFQVALLAAGVALAGVYSTADRPIVSATEPIVPKHVNWRSAPANYIPPVMDFLSEDRIPLDAPPTSFICPAGSETFEVSFEAFKEELYIKKYGRPSASDPAIQMASLPSGSSSSGAAYSSPSATGTQARRRSARLSDNQPARGSNGRDGDDHEEDRRGPGGPPATNEYDKHSGAKKANGQATRKYGSRDEPPPPPPPGPPSSTNEHDDAKKPIRVFDADEINLAMLFIVILIAAYSKYHHNTPEPKPEPKPLPISRGIPDHPTALEGALQLCTPTLSTRRRALPYGHPSTPYRSSSQIIIPLEGPSFDGNMLLSDVTLAHSDIQPFSRVIGREVVPCPEGFVEVKFDEWEVERWRWRNEIIHAVPRYSGSSDMKLRWNAFVWGTLGTMVEMARFFVVFGGLVGVLSFLVVVGGIVWNLRLRGAAQKACFDDQPRETSAPSAPAPERAQEVPTAVSDSEEALLSQPTKATVEPITPAPPRTSGSPTLNPLVFESFCDTILDPVIFDSFAEFGTPAASSTEVDLARFLAEPSVAVEPVSVLTTSSAAKDEMIVSAVQVEGVVQDDDGEEEEFHDASDVFEQPELEETVTVVQAAAKAEVPVVGYAMERSSSRTSIASNSVLNPKAAPFIPRSPSPVTRPPVTVTSPVARLSVPNASSSPPGSPSASTSTLAPAPAAPVRQEKTHRRRRKHKSQINRERREREAAAAAEAAALAIAVADVQN